MGILSFQSFVLDRTNQQESIQTFRANRVLQIGDLQDFLMDIHKTTADWSRK